MSKADKDKMKKEEQERKALEEEAAKIRALEEAKKQKKEEAALAVERAKQENEEKKRRRLDMTELQDFLDNNKRLLLELNQSRRSQAKWDRYMRCDGSPDPVNQGEINTYINLRREDNTRNSAENVLKDTQLDLSLIEELKFLLEDTPPEEITEVERDQHKETIQELENLITDKLALGTLQILCDATALADSETGNLQHVVKNDQISLCCWGNIMKNPRIRSFEFQDIHFTFDIPRVLSLSDCAVLVMNTKFDHLSPTSKASIPRRKKVEEELPPEGAQESTEKKEGEEGEEGEKEDEEKKEGEEEEKEETELDLMAALRGAEGEEEEAKEEEEQQEEPEEDFADPPTPEPTEWEDFDEADDIVDLRGNDVLGGIFQFNLLQMPPQPKTVGSWVITQMVDPAELVTIDYQADPPAQPVEGGAKESKDTKDKKDDKPWINVSMVLPDDVLFLEEPQVARWDYKRKFWSTDGFSDYNFNEEARTFTFKTSHFGTFCLVQDSHINMPFQSWEIRPHALNSAVFTIIAAIVEIEIEIKDALCCLSQPKDKPELESIRGKWVTPAELIMMMKKAGVNVFPNEDSSKFVSIQNKHPLIEERVYQQMALTASAMAYSWSKWNGEREREEVVFQAAEALEDEPLLEEDWAVYLATKKRTMKLKMTEFDEAFSSDAEGEGDFKCNIYHLMADVTSETAQARVKDTNFQFVDCVEQLLKATKVLTYA